MVEISTRPTPLTAEYHLQRFSHQKSQEISWITPFSMLPTKPVHLQKSGNSGIRCPRHSYWDGAFRRTPACMHCLVWISMEGTKLHGRVFWPFSRSHRWTHFAARTAAAAAAASKTACYSTFVFGSLVALMCWRAQSFTCLIGSTSYFFRHQVHRCRRNSVCRQNYVECLPTSELWTMQRKSPRIGLVHTLVSRVMNVCHNDR